ncbi:phage/plasmid primase, P4 family [Fusobacterium varium]|uniref:phage/plasmid primase, P4 family n=1 Tax=Fusobacterium varium TaxID=856 RepID=UPI002FE459E9
MKVKPEHLGIYRGYGYVLNTGKFTKYKGNAKLLDYQAVAHKNGFFGVLAPGIAYIDVDIREQAEFLYNVIQEIGLKCKVFETIKGKHFIFRDPKGYLDKTITKQYLACGIVADSKSGNANGVEYLKKVGELTEREIVYGLEFSVNELDELPTFLKPFKPLGDFDENIDKDTGELKQPTALFNDLGEGSRNDTLTRHILALQNVGFTDRDEIRDIIRVINSYFFADPLEDKELETILRDETFTKGEKENIQYNFFSESGKFYFNNFAEFLKEQYGIIKIDGELHCYEDGIYVKDKGIEKLMINIIPNLKDSNRKEVLKYLDLITEEKERDNTGLIAFKNGIYNILSDELLPFNPKYIITNKIPWNYNLLAYSELMDTTLNKFAYGNENIRLLIDEVIGYILFAKNEMGKAFIITGDKSNGKSTFLKILMYTVGKDNTSALSLNDIINSRFRVYEVAGKLLNIGDDIGSGYIPEAEILRKLVTGDIIVAEQKGKNPIKFNCYAKFIFSANDIPRIKDPTGATARRIIIIPFKNSFTKESKDYDPYFLDKIKTQKCIEYLIVVGIIGLKRIIQNKGFTETEETRELLEEFNRNNNPVLSIIAQLEDEKGEEFYIGMDKNLVYNYYYSEAQSEGMKPVTLTNFTRTMKKHKNLTLQDSKQNNQRAFLFQKV